MKTTNEQDETKMLNYFFSEIDKNLHILQTNRIDSIVVNIRGPALKAILKYSSHSSILVIKEKTKSC